ncbi:MAG: hypothetical protein PHP89_07075, partial [Candidatus Omnitrophica bacterium]|nr:hypothetical protein [Candidatus Omnitrophota bacterium]
MPFNLETSIAVRERPDGLLEKDTFDLSTAVPVEQSMLEPKPIVTPLEKPNWILDTGSKIQSTINKLFTIPGQEKSIPEITIEALSHANDKVYTGRMQIAKLEDIPEEQLPYIQKAPNRPGYYEYQHAIPVWEAAIEMGAQAFVVGYAGVQGFKAIKTEMGIRSLARDIAKGKAEYADSIISLNSPESLNKMGKQLGETNPNYIKTRNALMNRWEQSAISKLQSLEVTEGGQVKTAAQLEIEGRNFFKLLGEEIKSLNLAMGEAGSIPIKRPAVGQSVQFTNPEGIILKGVIKEITGQRAIIDMDGRQVVAVLSQLSLPEAQPT